MGYGEGKCLVTGAGVGGYWVMVLWGAGMEGGKDAVGDNLCSNYLILSKS